MSVEAVAGSGAIEGEIGLGLEGEFGEMVIGQSNPRTVKPSAEELEMEESVEQKISKVNQMIARARMVGFSDKLVVSISNRQESSDSCFFAGLTGEIGFDIDKQGTASVNAEIEVKKDQDWGSFSISGGAEVSKDRNGNTGTNASVKIEVDIPF